MKKVIWEEIGGERKEKTGSSKVILHYWKLLQSTCIVTTPHGGKWGYIIRNSLSNYSYKSRSKILQVFSLGPTAYSTRKTVFIFLVGAPGVWVEY